MFEHGKEQNLLEINIPCEYDRNIGLIRGRIAIDEGNHYILRSTIGMTTSGRVNIQDQVENRLRNRVVYIEKKPWIVVCNIDDFDIKEVITVLDVIKSCKVPFQNIESDFMNKVYDSMNSNQESRKARLKRAPKKPTTTTRSYTSFNRNPDVVAEVLFKAKGVCEICKKEAPFINKSDNTPYLEVHHKQRLSDGGDDTVENAIALCPNCHRKQHYG